MPRSNAPLYELVRAMLADWKLCGRKLYPASSQARCGWEPQPGEHHEDMSYADTALAIFARASPEELTKLLITSESRRNTRVFQA